MYELWAKRRPVEGKGYPFEYISSFTRKEAFYYITDQLDRSIYQECLIVRDNVCVFYREFEKPLEYRRVKK